MIYHEKKTEILLRNPTVCAHNKMEWIRHWQVKSVDWYWRQQGQHTMKDYF